MRQTNIPLNETGTNQTHKAKELLKKKEFGKIWSSFFQRAQQTAKIIKANSSCSIGYSDHLQERDRGKGEGQFYTDFKRDKLS